MLIYEQLKREIRAVCDSHYTRTMMYRPQGTTPEDWDKNAISDIRNALLEIERRIATDYVKRTMR